jgi:hypothetical protein
MVPAVQANDDDDDGDDDDDDDDDDGDDGDDDEHVELEDAQAANEVALPAANNNDDDDVHVGMHDQHQQVAPPVQAAAAADAPLDNDRALVSARAVCRAVVERVIDAGTRG